MTKKRKPSPEALRQRPMAFYHGIPRDTLRDAARRAKESRKTPKPGEFLDLMRAGRLDF